MPPRTDQPSSTRSFIVIVSPSYGGAEKRFFDIFRGLRARGDDVCLIAPSSLTRRLLEDHPGEPGLRHAVMSVPLDEWQPLGFIRKYRRLLATLPRGSNFHYPMNCLWPLHIGRGDAVTMSVTNCVVPPAPSFANRTRLWSWLSFFFVRRIDILSPAILSSMAGYRTAGKMSLTPGGTFIETQPSPLGGAREPVIALLSRLVPRKGIDDLFDVLPEVWRLMQPRVPSGVVFRIAGYGPLQDHVVGRIATLADAGVPIEFLGYVDARTLLPTVSLALSMQEVTNYPSRVVAEALVSGCGVVVRDTGDSRHFGDLPGLRYCSASLAAGELADKIVSGLEEIISDADASAKIQAAALDRFGARQSVDYFHDMLGAA